MYASIFQKITAGLLALASAVGIYHAPVPQLPTLNIDAFYHYVDQRVEQLAQQVESNKFGATIPVNVASFETSLASGISASATSMTLVRGTDDAGTTLSGYMCFTVDVNTTKQEFVCGTVAGTAVTSMIRGVDPQDGDLEVTALKQTHRIGAKVTGTDYPVIAILARILNGNETIPNVLSYSFSSTSTITSAANLVNKAYADALAIAGAPDGSTSQKGIYEQATSAETIAGTATGGTGAQLVPANSLFNATSSAATIVPVTKTTGKLDPNFIDATGAYSFTNIASITMSTATSTATSTDVFNLIPAGVVQMYATSTAPAGWLKADGTSYTTSTYPRLFAVIGYTYGGSSSNFSVPNMGGRFPAGASSTLSTSIGATGGSLTTTGTASVTAVGGVNTCAPGGSPCTAGAGPGYTFTSSSGASTGTTAATSTPPYIILNFIIKY